MKFKREYGYEFDWYGVDSTGSIALFASGCAAVPKLVFADEEKYLKTKEYFEKLPISTEARLSFWYESKKHQSANGFANQILESQTGIYTFYDKYYTNIYELVTVPKTDIKFLKLPEDIQNLLRPFTFEEIIFAETESIEVTKFFDCEERS